MKTRLRTRAVAALALLAGVACADLEVTNPNDPDAERALKTPDDVESLIAGSLNTWFGAYYDVERGSPGAFLSSQSFQHSSTPANFAMLHYSAIPRAGIPNDPAGGDPYTYMAEPWSDSYGALAAVRSGFLAIEEDPAIAEGLGDLRVQRARAFGRFVQGMAHATLAVLYDKAFIVDETVNTEEPETLEPVDYNAVMDAAMKYFDEAIALSEGAAFTIPANWIFQTETSAAELAQIAHSQKARFRAAVARTPEERRNVDWEAVIADVDAGVPNGWLVTFDWDFDWYHGVIDYGNFDGWSQMNYFMLGMADTSGRYQEWLSLPVAERHPDLPSGRPFLIITPDRRFPQGTTIDEQRQNPGTVWMIPCTVPEGVDDDSLLPGDPCFANFTISNMWVREARGTWRWSYYWSHEFGKYNYGVGENYKDLYEIDPAEMRLLKAEGMYWLGQPGWEALVDVTRTAAGLDPISDGSNDDCVPRLPSGECGDLFEALKWEKRMEVRFEGLFGAPWYFDSRGWGDLYYGTQLQFPVPCQELDILNRTPCYTFGGVGGEWSAPVSTYAFPFEG
ncbi:MAG TPA: hypothetical protein VF158_11515 [Longimicrobiales bacterium]